MTITEQTETRKQIADLEAEIERYQQAIYDAEGALDSAEKELKELLASIDREQSVAYEHFVSCEENEALR